MFLWYLGKGWSNWDLAAAAQMTQSYISQLLTRKKAPPALYQLFKACPRGIARANRETVTAPTDVHFPVITYTFVPLPLRPSVF